MPNTNLISDFFVPVFGCCFVIDRSSHVCAHLSFRSMIISLHQVLMEAASIAIWNKNKIAVGLAIGTWGINIPFLIQGMSCSFHPAAGRV